MTLALPRHISRCAETSFCRGLGLSAGIGANPMLSVHAFLPHWIIFAPYTNFSRAPWLFMGTGPFLAAETKPERTNGSRILKLQGPVTT